MSKRKSKRNREPKLQSFKRGFGPRTQFSQNEDFNTYLYTKGGEYTDRDGIEYEGEYHIKKDGRAYTGPIPLDQEKNKAIQLLQYYASIDAFNYDKLNKFSTPIKDHRQPTPYQYVIPPGDTAYRVGFSVRYFVQKTNNTSYPIEIDKPQRDLYGSPIGIDNDIYKLVELQWRLTGGLDLIQEENEKNVMTASSVMPDLPSTISSFTQYAQPTNQTTTPNIDSLLVQPKFSNNSVPIKKTFNRTTGEII